MNPDLGVGSHVPVLAAALAKTVGPVLELGTGHWSTHMLRLICRAQGRKLESYDSDPGWAAVMGVPVVERWDKWEPKESRYGVVFIDCSPGEERKILAMRLKDRAKFLVLHDHEAGSAAAYYYEHIIEHFKFNEVYRKVRPHTLILSDEEAFGLTPDEQEFKA